MANLAMKGHATRGKEVIEILEMLGGKNIHNYGGTFNECYAIDNNKICTIYTSVAKIDNCTIFTLEEFEEKYPYKVGDKVTYICDDLLETQEIINMQWDSDHDCVLYYLDDCNVIKADYILYQVECSEDNIPATQDKSTAEAIKEDKGNISDGYHTFNELYEYRLLYNASMFNEFAKQNLYDVHKSKLHSDGTIPFGDENWFIVQAELPTGQISNHYEMKDWDLFQVPIKEKANHYDGHTPQDVAKRLREFLTPKPQYPKTYEECCKVLDWNHRDYDRVGYESDLLCKLQVLLLCRDAYWKIAGEEMGLDKPWKQDYDDKCFIIVNSNGDIRTYEYYGTNNIILAFPTAEIRDVFYDNFKELIEFCKELL